MTTTIKVEIHCDPETTQACISKAKIGQDHPLSPQAPAALEWSDTLLDGETATYEKAEEAAQTLGDGWRLPSRKELESLVNTSAHNPAIDTGKFPATKSERYWTSTACAWNDAAVWVVDFNSGYVGSGHRYYLGCVRAVRSGQ